jgi:muramoyltetrapeptide carboxypeptidase
VKGPRLSPGATVVVPFPASPVSLAAAAKLEESGFAVAFAEETTSPRERAGSLADAFADPSVGAIICNGDASSAAELLRHLDYELIAQNPKPFVGSGEATLLHVALGRASGLVTFWGPLLPHLAGDTSTREALLRALTGFDVCDSELGDPLVRGIAEGELVGGDSAALCSLMGTPWEPETRGRILLLSAPAHRPWRIHPHLLHLVNAGKLQQCAGLYVTGVGAEGIAAEHVESVLRPLGVPTVVAGPTGPRMPTLPLGARARLDAYEGRLEILEAGVH